nr:MAG TPA: hypothetical protein [Caudoviricetes sp.]
MSIAASAASSPPTSACLSTSRVSPIPVPINSSSSPLQAATRNQSPTHHGQ